MFSTFVGPLGIVFYLNSILNNCCSWNMYDNAERQKVLYCTHTVYNLTNLLLIVLCSPK